jgi:hypothetical protein
MRRRWNVSELRELLHGAAPSPSEGFEAAEVSSAVVRRRKARRRATVAFVLLLAALVVAGLELPDQGHKSVVASRDPGAEGPASAVWPMAGVQSIATGGGQLWVGVFDVPRTSAPSQPAGPPRYLVRQLDPASGRVLAEAAVQGPLVGVAVAADARWVWAWGGGGTGRETLATVSVLSANGEVLDHWQETGGPNLSAVVTDSNVLWGVSSATSELLRISFDGHIQVDRFPTVGTPLSIARSGIRLRVEGAANPSGPPHELWEHDLAGRHLETLTWSGRLIGTAPDGKLWAVETRAVTDEIVELDPAALSQRNEPAQAIVRRVRFGMLAGDWSVVPDDSGPGVFVLAGGSVWRLRDDSDVLEAGPAVAALSSRIASLDGVLFALHNGQEVVRWRPPPASVRSTSTTATPTTLPTTTPTDGAAVVSAEIVVGGTPTLIAGWSFHSAGNGATGRIDVLQLQASWRVVASFDVAQPGIYDYSGASQTLAVRDVTGDGRLDVLFPLMAASNAPYVVLSDDGGMWRLVGFGATEQTVAMNPDEPDGNVVVTTSNLCTPTCAAGHVRRQQWRYSPDRRVFVEVATAECDTTGFDTWQCVPADSPLQNGRRLQVSR